MEQINKFTVRYFSSIFNCNLHWIIRTKEQSVNKNIIILWLYDIFKIYYTK